MMLQVPLALFSVCLAFLNAKNPAVCFYWLVVCTYWTLNAIHTTRPRL